MALPSKLPLPSFADLATAVAAGQDACDDWSARFATWSVAQTVPHIVMNALDPRLIEAVLGPEESQRWLPLLREHYARVKYSYPRNFALVEQSWKEQRQWWYQFVEFVDQPADDAQADGAGRGVAGPTDTVHPAPAGPVRTSTHKSAHRPSTGPASAAPVSSASAAPVGGVAHAPTGAAPAPQLTPDSRDPDVPVAEPGKQPPSPLPVAAAQPSPDVAPPPKVAASDVADEPPRLGASAAGPATAGARGRQLLEAAAVSHDAVRAVIAEWSREPRDVSEWRTWALSSTDVQGRARQR